MASPATATLPPSNAASGNPPTTPNAAPFNGGAKSHLKANVTGKTMDGSRRQSGSPVDGPQRRNSSQKAWTQGTNPLTQRSSNGPSANGFADQTRASVKNPPSHPKETNTPDRHANDRLLFLLASSVGHVAIITIKNGDVFEGIFSGSSFDAGQSAWLLKMVKQTAFGSGHQVNGVEKSGPGYVGTGPEHAMRFETKDVVDLSFEGVTLSDSHTKAQEGPSTASSFRTDADISGNLAARERPLQRWEPAGGDTDTDLSLESTSNANTSFSKTNTSWDQFEVNERLYGVKTDYDETMYTTPIDRSGPLYKQRLAEAERIARDIESSNAMTLHVAEERGIVTADDSGVNEEDKYSGVNRVPAGGSLSQPGQFDRYTPPARRAPGTSSASTATLQDPAILSSQIARGDMPVKGPEGRVRLPPAQQRILPSPSNNRVQVGAVDDAARPGAISTESSTARSKAMPSEKGTHEVNQKQASPLVSTGGGNPSSYAKAPAESATATVENDVRDAFKQFASTEKMRLQERRRNQAKHDKDIKLNDLMKFSQNFKLLTPVPRDLVPILAKDKNKQEEIVEKAQRNAKELNQDLPAPGHKPIATIVDHKPQRMLATTRYDPSTSLAQQAATDRQSSSRGRFSGSVQNNVNGQQMRQQQNIPAQPGRQGANLGQRLTNMQQQNRGVASHSGIPPPLTLQDGRVPPTGPAAITTHGSNPTKYSGAPTPTSTTSSHFNVKALEFKPNPAATSFTPTGDPSGASSPRSIGNAGAESRVPTPSNFFGSKKPLPASERPSIKDFFNPIKRLRKEAEDNKEDWTANGGIRPAHKTGPRWDVAEGNKEKTYSEMFDKIPFSTQSASPQPTQYVTPQMTHQHQLPFHLQLSSTVNQHASAPHQGPHHLYPQPQQQHHHAVGMPHHFDEHRLHISPPTVLPSPRLQPVNMAYPSPMGQHAQLVYGQPVPQYGMGPVGAQMAPLRQFSGAPHFVSQHGGHITAPMMTHSPSGGHLSSMSQGYGGSFTQQMPVYSPNPVHAYPHHGGPPPPQPGSNGYPSPGRGAPMMIHQGSQQGQPAHQMMMFGMSPGQQTQHLYVPHQPGQVSAPRGGGYVPAQQPHYGVIPHSHPYPSHQRNGPNYGHPPLPTSVNVGAQSAPPIGSTGIGPEGDEETK